MGNCLASSRIPRIFGKACFVLFILGTGGVSLEINTLDGWM